MNEIAFSQSGAAPMMLPSRPGNPIDEPETTLVTRLLTIAHRSKWLILGSITSAVLIGLVITILMTPQFTATTRLEINRIGSRIVNVQGVQPEASLMDPE